MLRRRDGGGRLLAAAFSAVVLLVGVPAAAGQPGTSSDRSTTVSHGGARAPQPSVHKVMLITGDEVTVSGDHYAIVRGPGRAKMSFATYRSGGHLHVIPADALPLLKSGRLDSRLFDVTTLLKFGNDERKAELPLIVAGPQGRGATGAKVTGPADAGLRITRDLRAVHGSAAKAAKENIPTLWKGLTGADKRAAAAPLGTAKVWLDGVRKPTLDVSVPLIGAPAAWQAGYTGAGVKVAVLDTGIDDSHPDLAGKVIAKQNFASEAEDGLDRVGHGTHVASTIAGSGAASGGKYKGVAPDAQLLNGKVCAEFGCDESWILAGMQWAAEQGADVANMSLGGGDSAEIDPLEQAVNDLTAQYGMLFVIAAGNDGYYGDGTLSSPASADAALAVAATTKQDELAEFSSRGPRIGDGAVKPDIAAPGVEITAARSSTGFLGEPGQLYMTLDGTSMATPHVVGSAALLVQEHPSWSPAQLKATLTAAAKPLDGLGGFAVGSGRVDVARAIGQTITTDKAVSFGRTLFPHGDDAPITKSVTFSNSGSSAVTLNLAVKAAGPGGASVPSGMFTTSAPTVTVPAGGTASVNFTADTRTGGADGLYSGQLVGTADGVSVSTAFGIEQEVESYDLTVKHTERDGDPSADHFTILTKTGVGQARYFMGDASQTMRVPKGDYILCSWINEPDTAFSMLFTPKLTVDHDMTVDADARLAQQVKVTVSDPASVDAGVGVDATIIDAERNWAGFSGLSDGVASMYSIRLDGHAPFPGLVSDITLLSGVPGPDGTLRNSPTMFNGAWFYPGDFPTGADKQITPQTGARVDMVLHKGFDSDLVVPLIFPYPAGDPFAGSGSLGIEVDQPLHRTVYYSTDPSAMFQTEIDYFDADRNLVAVLQDKFRTYPPGTVQTQHWNNAVFGPSFASAGLPWQFLTRYQDTMLLSAPLYSDGSGHAGYGLYTSAKSTLWRNGKVFASDTTPWLEAEVPAAPANYKYTVEIQRGGPLSTKVTSTWTFRSQHVPASDEPFGGYEQLPLTAITFAPAVDDDNKVAAGQLAVVPITVSTQAGAKPLESLTVESSINDGKAWTKAAVFHVGSSWYALVPQKSGATVSLRASGVDAAGKTVDLTVIRAYQVK